MHFNSHPHEEDDICVHDFLNQLIYFNSHPHEEDDHTQGMKYFLTGYFNSHPHEEDDGLPAVVSDRWKEYFNSHPHEEDDRKGSGMGNIYRISTHILTKRMTENEAGWMDNFIFQLTSSRRG